MDPKDEYPPRPEELGEYDDDAKHNSSNSSSRSDDEEDEGVKEGFNFPDDAAADAVREEAVALYNSGNYNEALDLQYRVVRYYSDKYGATSVESGKYFLDYALSQLRVLQSQSGVEDVLQPRDEEAMEACFINLEIARVCLQKREDGLTGDIENGEFVETELMLAEVHNSLAQLFVEKEDYDSALKEYEAELLVYRSLQSEEGGDVKDSCVPAGRLVAALYSVADCFIKEQDFAGAEERLEATLEEVGKYPEGTIAAELLEELHELLKDAREMKDGRFEKIRDEIARQFIVQEADRVPTAPEFYEMRPPTVVDANGEERTNPYVSAVPGGAKNSEGSHLSMPMSAHGTVLGFDRGAGVADNENSNSVSLFPPQHLSRSSPPCQPLALSRESSNVNIAVARKKPKVRMGSPSVSNGVPPTLLAEPAAKKSRAEE